MDDIRTYNNEDIQQYLQHKMSAADMHAFEKAMMDDPFLADAIEGFRQSNEALSAKHLDQLQHRLKGEEYDAKLVVMPVQKNTWWKAAAVVFFILAGTLSYMLWDNSSTKNITQLSNTNPEATPVAKDSAQLQTATLSNQNATAQSPNFAQSESVSTNLSKENRLQSDKFNYQKENSPALAMNEKNQEKATRPAKMPAPTLFERNMKDDQQTNDEVKDKTSVTAKAAAPSADVARESKSSENAVVALARKQTTAPYKNETLQGRIAGVQQNNISIRGTGTWQNDLIGKVIDASGKPVAGATIRSLNQNTITSSDAYGNFTIKGDSTTEVMVNSVGYAGAVAKIKSGTSNNNIVLKENQNSLSEVVVTGYGTQKKRSVTGSVSAVSKKDLAENPPATSANQSTPEPKGGWQAFDDYANKEVREHKDTSATGVYDAEDVVLEFSIDKKGRPVDITIVRTGTRNDALQAINILKKGPLWNNTVKDARVVYTFKFKR